MDKSVLIIEDDLSLRKALVLKLTKSGFTVYEAKTGREGVDMARKNNPNCLLLDIMMPEMNGLDVLKEIRDYPALISTPVIVLTNMPEEGTAEKVIELGGNEYLVKSNTSLEKIVTIIKGYVTKNIKNK